MSKKQKSQWLVVKVLSLLLIFVFLSGCASNKPDTSDSAPSTSQPATTSQDSSASSEEKTATTDDKYPDGPITVIVGYGAGGSTDLATRVLADGMKEYLGVPVMVNNITGGNGIIGLTEVAKAEPDGYTIGACSGATLAVAPSAVDTPLPFSNDELVFCGRFLTYTNILWASTKAPFKTVEEMIEYGKNNPGKLIYGAEETYGINPVGTYVLMKAAGNIQYVPLVTSGSAETTKNLVAGDIDFINMSLSPVLPYYESGEVTPLLIMADKAPEGFEDVPLALDKFDGYDIAYTDFAGLVLPKGAPEEIRAKIEEAIEYTLNTPAFQTRFKELGVDYQYYPGDKFKNDYAAIKENVLVNIEEMKAAESN